MFVIEWADDSVSYQNSRHIFGSFTRRQKMALGDYVLAMVSESTMSYLPGKVTGVQGRKLTVEFCDGSRYVVLCFCFFFCSVCLFFSFPFPTCMTWPVISY